MNLIPLRRFITSDDAQGRSSAELDDPTRNTFQQGTRPVALTDLWRMTEVPTPVDAGENRSEPFRLSPPERGVQFRIVQFDPGSADAWNGAEVFAGMGASQEHAGNPDHPFMHRTHTVDFGIVLQGRITMVLDLDSHELHAGDVVIQRATNHEWRNLSDEPCLVAFILVAGA